MKVLALTNLFPRPWDQTRATFNKSIFDLLDARVELDLFVAVPIVEALRHWRRLWWVFRFGKQGYARYFVAMQLPGRFRRANHFLYFFSLILQSPSLLFRTDYCIAFGSWIFPDSAALGLLSWMHSKPQVTMALGTDVNQGLFDSSTKAGALAALARSKRVIVVSQAMKAIVLAKGIESNCVRVIPTGVDGDQFRIADLIGAKLNKAKDPKAKHILFVGSLIRTKGCFELVEAISILTRKESLRIQVSIVGQGADRHALEAEIRRYGLESVVQLVGAVSHRELPGWFQSADVFCLPSHREGLPNVILEALSCGIPVVATAVGGIPDLVNDSVGKLVEVDSPSQLAASLETVMTQAFQPNVIRSTVSQYRWSYFIDQLLANFTQVLDE